MYVATAITNPTPDQVLSNIKAEMARRGINQTALASILGVHPATLSEVLTGKANLSTARLIRIADVLDIHVGVLMAGAA